MTTSSITFGGKARLTDANAKASEVLDWSKIKRLEWTVWELEKSQMVKVGSRIRLRMTHAVIHRARLCAVFPSFELAQEYAEAKRKQEQSND